MRFRDIDKMIAIMGEHLDGISFSVEKDGFKYTYTRSEVCSKPIRKVNLEDGTIELLEFPKKGDWLYEEDLLWEINISLKQLCCIRELLRLQIETVNTLCALINPANQN